MEKFLKRQPGIIFQSLSNEELNEERIRFLSKKEIFEELDADNPYIPSDRTLTIYDNAIEEYHLKILQLQSLLEKIKKSSYAKEEEIKLLSIEIQTLASKGRIVKNFDKKIHQISDQMLELDENIFALRSQYKQTKSTLEKQSNLLKAEKKTREQAAHFLDRIPRGIKRLKKIIDAIDHSEEDPDSPVGKITLHHHYYKIDSNEKRPKAFVGDIDRQAFLLEKYLARVDEESPRIPKKDRAELKDLKMAVTEYFDSIYEKVVSKDTSFDRNLILTRKEKEILEKYYPKLKINP